MSNFSNFSNLPNFSPKLFAQFFPQVFCPIFANFFAFLFCQTFRPFFAQFFAQFFCPDHPDNPIYPDQLSIGFSKYAFYLKICKLVSRLFVKFILPVFINLTRHLLALKAEKYVGKKSLDCCGRKQISMTIPFCFFSEHLDLRHVMGVGIAITRGSAASLSFCYCLLLLTMCR